MVMESRKIWFKRIIRSIQCKNMLYSRKITTGKWYFFLIILTFSKWTQQKNVSFFSYEIKGESVGREHQFPLGNLMVPPDSSWPIIFVDLIWNVQFRVHKGGTIKATVVLAQYPLLSPLYSPQIERLNYLFFCKEEWNYIKDSIPKYELIMIFNIYKGYPHKKR